MNQRKFAAILSAALLLTALPACSKSEDGSSTAAETTTSAAATETTAATSEMTTTTTAVTTTSAETTTAAETAETDSTETTASGEESGTAGATKLLWSERGLEAVPADSEEGYGSPLEAGAEYLGWTLKSYSGKTDGDRVTELDADFDYSGALSTNGIMTVLPDSDPDNPNGLYLRVDNQAEFPFFPADTRERGYFIIENKEDVYEWLELDEPPVSAEYTVAVTVDVTKLQVHYSADGYDRITVTSASKR